MRRVGLFQAWTAEEVWALIGRRGARTLVFDVEPLVAVWATDTPTLDAGVAETLGRVAGLVAGLRDNGPHGPAREAGADGPSGGGGESGVGELADSGSAGTESASAGSASSGSASPGSANTGPTSPGPTSPESASSGSAGGWPRLEVVAFATNSDRLPTVLPGLSGARVGYRASAAKPLRIQGFRDLPCPGLVIGDQIATDGALAWRLGFDFDFVYYRPARGRIPLRPRLLHLVGAGLRPLLFEVPPFR